MNQPCETSDQDTINKMVADERLALCDLLDQLAPDDWQTQSLCAQWTVRDVVAHLSLATSTTLGGVIIGMIKGFGSFDRMNTNAAIDRSQKFNPAELVQQLRESAGSSQRNPMSTLADQLVDILVHTEDITQPLGRSTAMNPEHAVPALDHAVNSRWYGGKKRFADVHGTAGDLLLMATGRTSVLGKLSGAGVNALAHQLSPA